MPISKAADLRPVYAGLNYTRHPYGAAPGYGSIILIYKKSIMHRCTFIPKDTFSAEFNFEKGTQDQINESRKKICTSAQFSTLIANLSDNQLVALCKASSGKYDIDDHPANYIEAHIHGGVKFAADLESIRIATTGSSTFEKEIGFIQKKGSTFTKSDIEKKIKTFANRFGVPVDYYSKDKLIRRLT